MRPFFSTDLGSLYHGHCLDVLKRLPDESVHCCVTSPPYWGLRDYGTDPQIWDAEKWCEHSWATNQSHESQFCQKCGAWKGSLGLEPTPQLFIDHMVQIFREAKRVLRDDGTIWVNMGDTYAASRSYQVVDNMHKDVGNKIGHNVPPGLKQKDLIGIPWHLAFALQGDGWYLRQDIVWQKPNPMPESVKDRCTKSHEYVFLLSKSAKYYCDMDAIKEKASPDSHARDARGRSDTHKWADGGPGNQSIAKSFEHMRKPGVNPKASQWKTPDGWDTGKGTHGAFHKKGREKGKTGYVHNTRPKQNESFSHAVRDLVGFRNKRSVWNVEDPTEIFRWLSAKHPKVFDEYFDIEKTDVWTIPTKPYSGAHFATFPPDLIKPCILAGCPKGGTTLDMFFGSGTTGEVCEKLNRKWVGIDLKSEYCDLSSERVGQEAQQLKLFAAV